MEKKRYHVSKTQEGWQGKLEKAGRASVTGETKQEVVKKTIGLAKKASSGEVVIHGRDGKIKEERTYPRSADPNPPKG